MQGVEVEKKKPEEIKIPRFPRFNKKSMNPESQEAHKSEAEGAQ